MEKLGVTLDLKTSAQVDAHFWRGKSVFITGHTGFKGSWLALWLSAMGAKVTGYALAPVQQPNLFNQLNLEQDLTKSHFANICDLATLQQAITDAAPEIVIHMAAQALVRYSYVNPVETYATNVMGTVNVLECVRSVSCVRAVVVVTSDKCYENKEWAWGYRENEAMGGFDPYSNSKGCAELVVNAYRDSFFCASRYAQHGVAIASARAGNVIGGGDWSQDRLIPDAIRAFAAKQALMIRNPLATRPWQHVLEPLSGYLILAQGLYEKGTALNGGWNFGPRDEDVRTVKEVIDALILQWGGQASWTQDVSEQPHEAHALKLDCSKAKQYLHWTPRWSLEQALQKIVEWHQHPIQSKLRAVSLQQINIFQTQ